jgi:hypothetical protein
MKKIAKTTLSVAEPCGNRERTNRTQSRKASTPSGTRKAFFIL